MNHRNLRQLGLLIQRHRNERGMTLRELAERTGITDSTLSRLEQGKVEKPNALHLNRIAQVFGIAASNYYALAGYLHPGELPEMRPYLRAKYGLSDAEAERVDEIFQALRGKWGTD